MASFFYYSPPDRPSNIVDFDKPSDNATLKGQNVLITGGSTGIGQACVVAFSQAGAYVTIADVNDQDGHETAENLKQHGHNVQYVSTDVTSWEALVNVFKASIEFGPEKTLDIVIPAAGISGSPVKLWLDNPDLDENGDPKPIMDKHKVVDVNLDAVFNTTHLALHYFRKYPGRKELDKQIVFVSSMAGYASITGGLGYCTSKWGVRGLFRSLRDAHGILGENNPVLRCNLIGPGFIKTPMTKPYWELEEKGQLKFASAGDVADVVLRLCADRNIIG